MNRCVPDFETDDGYSLPSLPRPRKSSLAGDEIMELLWQNGPVVMPNQRSVKKSEASEFGGCELVAPDQATPSAIPNHTHHHHQQQQQQNLFMQEDEMASWLHYPLHDTSFVADFCSDLLYPSASVNNVAAAASPASTVSAAAAARTAAVISELRQQPPPKPPMPMAPPRRFENFGHFSRLNRPRVDEYGPSNSSRAANESTVVDSSGTPAVGPGYRVSEALHYEYDVSRGTVDGGAAALATSSADGGGRECELTVTSSPGASSACAEPPPPQKSSTPPPPPPPEDRKRKGIEIDADADTDADADECNSEDVELEYADTKKQARSTSTKRSRAAEVHNLSERRRRDRINEKMRALQELIPHCNKADKASMLDEAIEYLKSLQMQVQMMSMGCSVVPMMFPGVHQYMPHMGMGIGMAMGMDMGMNRPMLPFPNVLSGSSLPTPAVGAHLGPRFPMPTFHMPHVPAPDPSRISPTVQSDPLLSSLALQSQNQARIPNFIDPYQQYFGLRCMQLPLQQNQTPSGIGKPSTGKVGENLEKPPSG